MESIPVRSFRGKTGENINVFLADLEVHYMPKDECYITQAQKNAAKLALLRSKLKGRASTFVLRQPPAISGSWEELIAVLKKKYDRTHRSINNKRRNEDKLLNLRQGSLSLKRYIKKTTKIAEQLSSRWDETAAKRFVLGIKRSNHRLHMYGIGNLGETFTLAEAINAARITEQAGRKQKKKKGDKSDDSSTSSSSSSSSSESSGDDSDSSSSSSSSGESKKRKRAKKKKNQKSKKNSKTPAVDDDEFSRLFKKMMTKEKNENAVSLASEVEAYAMQRQGPPRYNDRPPVSNQAPGMSRPQYPGGYGPAVDRQQAFSRQGPYLGRRHSVQGDTRSPSVCYRCGEHGHYSADCTNPPLPREEQYRVRQKAEEELAERILAKYRNQGEQAPQSNDARVIAPQGPAGVHGVEVVRSKGKGEDMQVPESSLIEWFEADADAVEKRGKDEAFGRWTRDGPPAGRRRVTVESESEEEPSQARGNKEAAKASGSRQAPEDSDTDAYNAPTKKTTKPKAPKAPIQRPPIRMMKGQIAEDVVARLRDTPVEGLTWGKLFELAPLARREVAKGLVQERIPRASKGKEPEQTHSVDESLAVETVKRRARADAGPVLNFYTHGNIKVGGKGHYSIKRILVDAGSVVNLMPEAVANAMGLTRIESRGISVKTADGSIAPINSAVVIDLEIAGVTASVPCYLMPGPKKPSYAILLSRRWLRQCQARGDYRTDTYIIKDRAGKEYVVPASKGNDERTPQVVLQPEAIAADVDDEVREELEGGEELMMEIVAQIVQQTEQQEREDGDDRGTGPEWDGAEENLRRQGVALKASRC